MENLISYLSDFANGWTVIDLLIMSILAYFVLKFKKQVAKKENLLFFADVQKEQQNAEIEEIKLQMSGIISKNNYLQKELDKKSQLLSKCIDRPTVNGRYVKKDYKPIIAYVAKENIYNKNGILIFTESMQYPKANAKAASSIGNDGVKYVIDTRKFTPAY